MAYIDQAVLNLTERICRWFQTMTGRTNVWLAFQLTNLSVIVYFIWVANVYLVSRSLAVRTFVAIFCGSLLWILSRTIFRTPIDLSENFAFARVAKGLRNPRRVRDVQLRVAFLTLSIVLSYPLWFVYTRLHLRSYVLLTEALIVLTTVVLYVLACDPLPPGTAKVTAWLRALTPARTEGAPAEFAERSKAA